MHEHLHARPHVLPRVHLHVHLHVHPHEHLHARRMHTPHARCEHAGRTHAQHACAARTRTHAHTGAPAPSVQPLNFAGATLALRGVGEIEGLFETTRLRFHDLPVRDKGDGPRLGLGLGLGLGLTLTIT